jgi:hypothetical protein
LDDFKLVSCSLDQTLKLWDLQGPHAGRCLQTLRLPAEACAVSAWGDGVLVGLADGRALLFQFDPRRRRYAAALGAADGDLRLGVGGSGGGVAIGGGASGVVAGAQSLLSSVLAGALGAARGGVRKGGAEQAFARQGSGRRSTHTARRGLRDLQAIVKGVEGPGEAVRGWMQQTQQSPDALGGALLFDGEGEGLAEDEEDGGWGGGTGFGADPADWA